MILRVLTNNSYLDYEVLEGNTDAIEKAMGSNDVIAIDTIDKRRIYINTMNIIAIEVIKKDEG